MEPHVRRTGLFVLVLLRLFDLKVHNRSFCSTIWGIELKKFDRSGISRGEKYYNPRPLKKMLLPRRSFFLKISTSTAVLFTWEFPWESMLLDLSPNSQD